MGSECEAHEYGQLVSRIDSFDIESRIGFRVPGLLRFGKNVRELAFFVRHLGEDVVGSSVDDSIDGQDAIRSQRFFQRLDDGNAAGDAGFESNLDGRGASLAEDL